MKPALNRALAALVCAICLLAPAGAVPTLRTIYVTVTDNKGVKVPGLTAADFAVKEGGKAVEIIKAEPAKARIHLALLVEDRLTPSADIRQALGDFISRMQPFAEISLITVGLSNITVVPYTQSLDLLVSGIRQFSLSGQPAANLTEGLLELSKELEKQPVERPVIVAVALASGSSSASADEVLGHLRQSGAGFFALTFGGAQGASDSPVGSIGDESWREQVLGDGTRQTGGRRINIAAIREGSKSLLQLADDLMSQYVITYALPEGAKLDRRLNVSLKPKGLTLRAPTALRDR
jgi:hypothetical protein